MIMAESVKIIKIKPLYKLLFLGIGQLYGAFVIYRLGVLKIKEAWINQVCLIAVLALVGWSVYLIYSFFQFYRLKDDKIILRENNLSLFGVEINYRDIKDFGIDTSDSVLSVNIYMKYLDEPIPVVSKFMKLKEFHLLIKTLIEKTNQNAM
ncbi:hypothetical protein [Allomuricauda sp. F6463D]|uniref:hypothetical protein n=1 Tax=Allomuricauda sp. F6463D TaxID=2926409 RepID=UPI001FF47273|nr:hypothetical protein [Muricauda sp. F6463D]MCK0159959.1 hypothetical protein [Muricauda sp. F6463D]